MRPKVYVSGPISSSGTYLSNAAFAIEVAEHLMMAGFAPYCPQLTTFMFIGRHHTVSHELWMECDESWIRSMDPEMDYMIRLYGRSVGGDIETEWAREMGMRVFHALSSVTARTVVGYFCRWTEPEAAYKGGCET